MEPSYRPGTNEEIALELYGNTTKYEGRILRKSHTGDPAVFYLLLHSEPEIVVVERCPGFNALLMVTEVGDQVSLEITPFGKLVAMTNHTVDGLRASHLAAAAA